MFLIVELKAYVDLNIVSAKKPFNTHLFWEHTTYGIFMIDSTNQAVLLGSTKARLLIDGSDWDTIDLSDNANSYKIQSGWLDGNDLWLVMCDNDGAADDFEVCYVELDDSNDCNPIGVSSGADINTVYAYDICKISSDYYVIEIEAQSTVNAVRAWIVTSAPFTEDDNFILHNDDDRCGKIAVINGKAYFMVSTVKPVDRAFSVMCSYDPGTNTIDNSGENFTQRIATLPTHQSLAYDGINLIYSILEGESDSLNYFTTYNISTEAFVTLGRFDISIMLDRNTAGGFLEKAFHDTEYKIYQLQENSVQLHLISQPNTDAVIIGITDNYFINNDGDMWEWTNNLTYVASIQIDHKIMEAPIAKIKLKKDTFSITKGMVITIEGEYTSQSDTNTATIFEGKVVDFDDKLLQTVWLESSALKELDKIFPEGTYSGSSQSIINSLITEYCKYISVGTLAVGIAMGSITYEGDKSLRTILLTLIYINNFIWALTPTGALNFNSGALDSGVDLTETDNVWRVRTGNQGEGMNYWKIRGAIVGGSQLEKILQDADDQLLNGLNPLSETYAELNSQSLVNIMAAARKTRTEDVSKIVNYKHYDPSLGFIQPGETKTFEYGLSEPVVAQDQFIIYGIKYDARGGIGDYKIADELI